MIKREESKLGTIDFEKPVAAHIVRKAVLRFRANALLTDPKMKTISLGQGGSPDSNSDYVKIVRKAEDEYSVSVNIVIRFGTSISRVTNEIITAIRKDLKEYMDFEPAEVIVRIVGVKSRSKPVIKRNIVIKG